jgi:hypothetical protein
LRGIDIETGSVRVKPNAALSVTDSVVTPVRLRRPPGFTPIVLLAEADAGAPRPRIELLDYTVAGGDRASRVVPVVLTPTQNALVRVAPFPRPAPTLPIPKYMDEFKGWNGNFMGDGCNAYPDAPQPTTKKVLVVAADGSGDFQTVQAAVAAVPGGRSSWAEAVEISIRPGVYNETVCISRRKGYLRLVGAGVGATTIARRQGSVDATYPKGFCAANAGICNGSAHLCADASVGEHDGCWPMCGVVRVLADDVDVVGLSVHNPQVGSNHVSPNHFLC